MHGDWQNLLIKTEFLEYRVHYNPDAVIPLQTPSPLPPLGLHASPRVRDSVFDFKKGIKRDAMSFTVLKENKQWDSAHRTLKAQAKYQDVDDILDPNYVPNPGEATALFEEKQKYMYTIFERILQTEDGRVIVRSHDKDQNAQLIYSELVQVMTRSTEAMMCSSELLSYLTHASIVDGSWRGTAKTFVLNWIDQLRQYHEMTPLGDRLSDNTQRNLLQTAVKGLDALRQVQLHSDLQQTSHGISLTFGQYCSLLINAATGYDNKGDKPTSAGKSHFSIHNAESYFGDYIGLNDDDAGAVDFKYSVDTTPTELHAYAANQRDRSKHSFDEKRRARPPFHPGSRMPFERWKVISDEAKLIWDTMADEDKAHILDLQTQRHEQSRHTQSKISANIHNATHDVSSDHLDDLLIAMVTKHTNRTLPATHPGDIRSVLSQPAKATKVRVQDGELTINGDKYVRKINSHDIRYNVSSTSRIKQSSLIDRGANGSIAGSDTRVIERHPHRTVDIRGIDNHEIQSIPIVTAGAVARSQRGDVILVMHQYAYHPQQGRSIHSACQLESFANNVNDKSIRVPGGLQCVTTVNGYVFPLSIRDGLPYLGMRPYTDGEYDSLLHVILSSNVDWDPRILDFDLEDTALFEEIKPAPLGGGKLCHSSQIAKTAREDVENVDVPVKPLKQEIKTATQSETCAQIFVGNGTLEDNIREHDTMPRLETATLDGESKSGPLLGSPSRDTSWRVKVGTTPGMSNTTRVHHLVYADKHDGRHKARFRLLFSQGDATSLLTKENSVLSRSLGSDNSPRLRDMKREELS